MAACTCADDLPGCPAHDDVEYAAHDTFRRTLYLSGRCDMAACWGPTAFITRGYLADGTAPTWNEACAAHAGTVAANYLSPMFNGDVPSFVRADITRIDEFAHDIR